VVCGVLNVFKKTGIFSLGFFPFPLFLP